MPFFLATKKEVCSLRSSLIRKPQKTSNYQFFMLMNHTLSKPAWICNFSGDSLLEFWKKYWKKNHFEKNPLKTKIKIYLNDYCIWLRYKINAIQVIEWELRLYENNVLYIIRENLKFLYGFMVTFCITKKMARKQPTNWNFSIICF